MPAGFWNSRWTDRVGGQAWAGGLGAQYGHWEPQLLRLLFQPGLPQGRSLGRGHVTRPSQGGACNRATGWEDRGGHVVLQGRPQLQHQHSPVLVPAGLCHTPCSFLPAGRSRKGFTGLDSSQAASPELGGVSFPWHGSTIWQCWL
jgi:hypothetical protein